MSSKRPEDHRRKFKAEDYESGGVFKRSADSDGELKQAKVAKLREKLQARTYKVDLDSKLGKTTIVNQTGTITIDSSTSQKNAAGVSGYYCNVCDCVIKDSINFLDHINGKKHQRNLGMNMKIERSTLDQVRDRLSKNKEKLKEEIDKKQKEYSFEEKMKELKEQEAKQKEFKKEKKKLNREKDELKASHINPEDDVAAVMGFNGFASSKK